MKNNNYYYFLTYNSKVDFQVPRRWISKIDTASVDSRVRPYDFVEHQYRWSRTAAEERSVSEDSRRGPQFGLVDWTTSDVVACNR